MSEVVRMRRVKANQCQSCASMGWDPPTCAYCSAPLSPRHEHDHVPVPRRHGGKQAVPICLNCHDLKDRVDPMEWHAEAMFEALEDAPPLARIVIARLLALVHDLHAEADERKAA